MLDRTKIFFSLTLLFISVTSISNASPEKFTTPSKAIISFHDYKDSKTFKTISENPYHLQLSPIVVPNDTRKTIEKEVKRSLIYGVYRSFIHTDINEVTITSVPLEINPKTRSYKQLNSYAVKITVSRSKALMAVKETIGVNRFDQLVEDQKIGDYLLRDSWAKIFDNVYYKEQGINLLVSKLRK